MWNVNANVYCCVSGKITESRKTQRVGCTILMQGAKYLFQLRTGQKQQHSFVQCLGEKSLKIFLHGLTAISDHRHTLLAYVIGH